MSDAAKRDVMKQTMLEDDDALKNKSNSSGSCLDVKNSNGLPDLNEPLEPVAVSRDITYPHNGKRKNSNGLADLKEPLEPVALSRDVEGQRLEKSKTQKRQMILEAGNDRITQIDPVTDHRKVKVSEERAYGKLKVGSRKPHVSYDGYLGSSSVPSNNAPRLSNDFFNPLSILDSSWENPVSNPFMNIDTHASGGGVSSFEMNSHVSNGLYQGDGNIPFNPSVSSVNQHGPKAFESVEKEKQKEAAKMRHQRKLKMKKIRTRSFKPLPSFENKGESLQEKPNEKTPGLMQNIPFDPSVSSVSQHGPKAFSVDKEKQKEAAKMRHQRKLKMKIRTRSFKPLPSFENKGESLQEKPNEKTPGMMQNIPFDSSVSSVNQHCPKAFESVDKEKQKEAAKMRHQRKLKMKMRTRSFKPLPSFENKGESLQEKPNEKTPGLMQNIPFDPSVFSVNQHGPKAFESVDKEKQKEAAKMRHQRKLKMKIRTRSFKPLPSFENKGESLQEKPNEKTPGLKQNISSSNDQRLLHDAISSSTDAATKDALSWFADIINSSNDEGNRVESSSEG